MQFRYDFMPAALAEVGRAIIARMISRRPLLIAGSLALVSASRVQAQQRRSLTDPLRVGADAALVDSGLVKALQQAFGRDTGIAVKLVRMPALPLLEALERGELDAGLTNAVDAELRLDRQGLVHDRQQIAAGEFVIVGPPARGKTPDPAGIAGSRDVAAAMTRIRDAALASAPGDVSFVSAGDGSGTHTAEQAAWRAAKIAPAAPWYLNAGSTAALPALARSRNAYALVERGAWAAYGGAPLAVLIEGDPLLAESVHVMRSFRVNHPAGKLFVTWITGPKGRRVVAAQRAYRSPTG
jgi:tungstate transport system substrate-binding protein